MENEFDRIKKAIQKKNELNSGNDKFSFIGELHEGLRCFQETVEDGKGGLFGYIDVKNSIVIEAVYMDAKRFSQDIAAVAKMVENEKIVEDLNTDQSVFSKLIHVFLDNKDIEKQKKAISKEIKYGYIDHKGEVQIQFQYDEAYSFQEGYAVARLQDDWQLINKKNSKPIKVDADSINYPYQLNNGKLSIKKNGKDVEWILSDLV